MRFSLLIKNGRVVDPAGGHAGVADVAIRGASIVAVEAGIPPESAETVIDATGKLVTPGLVDLHSHIYIGVGRGSIDPAPLAWRTGTTAWVDAGTAGAYTFAGLRDYVIRPSHLTLRAFLNISSIGILVGTAELSNPLYVDADVCAQVALANADVVVGIKARIDRETVGELGLYPLEQARAAADAAGMPLMVHISHGPPAVEDVLRFLGPGDILTHCLTGLSMKVIDDDGRPLQALLDAKERGVLFDLGHGTGSFSWSTADAWAAAGLAPDFISSDLHSTSIQGPLRDLPTCMSKLMSTGMSLEAAVTAATSAPAAVAGLSGHGTLRPGSVADVAVFAWDTTGTELWDSYHASRAASGVLRNVATVRAGKLLEPVLPAAPAPWYVPTRARAEMEAEIAQVTRAADLAPDSLPEGFGDPEPIR